MKRTKPTSGKSKNIIRNGRISASSDVRKPSNWKIKPFEVRAQSSESISYSFPVANYQDAFVLRTRLKSFGWYSIQTVKIEISNGSYKETEISF